jgi:hypothetical protein
MTKLFKEEHRLRNIKFLDETNIPYTKCTDYHLKVPFGNGKVADFYPSTNKWVVGTTTFLGDAEKLWNWIGEIEEENAERLIEPEEKSVKGFKDFNDAVEALL